MKSTQYYLIISLFAAMSLNAHSDDPIRLNFTDYNVVQDDIASLWIEVFNTTTNAVIISDRFLEEYYDGVDWRPTRGRMRCTGAKIEFIEPGQSTSVWVYPVCTNPVWKAGIRYELISDIDSFRWYFDMNQNHTADETSTELAIRCSDALSMMTYTSVVWISGEKLLALEKHE